MKYLFLALVLVCISCNSEGTNKATQQTPLSSTKIVGSWELSETKISPGSPVEWTAAEDTNTYQFELDGNYTYTNNGDKRLDHQGTYRVKDDELLLTYSSEVEEVKKATYRMTLSNAELILDYVGCTEECRLKYKRKAE